MAVIIPCLQSCSRPKGPQAALDQAAETFGRGDTALALLQAEQGYFKFRDAGAEWAWKFTILRGRALYRQGRYESTLTTLLSEPTAPPTKDLAIRQMWLEGLAYTSLHKFPDAEQKLQEADSLCQNAPGRACAYVATARGTLEMERAHYADAQVYFERVLLAARATEDYLWIANSLLDLSWCAEEQTHFDRALDFAEEARKIAEPRNFASVSQTALGNMAWAYYRLGDLEKAQAAFTEARNQALKLGDDADQLRWLLDLGYVYFDARDLRSAEVSYRHSLEFSVKLKNREATINALQALAFLCEESDKADEATGYASEALSLARADGNKRDETYPRLVQGRIAARVHDFNSAEAAFHEVASSSDSPVFLKWEAERSLARLYEDENQIGRADGEYRTALSTFEGARSELQHENSRLPFLNNATRIYDDYIHLLVSQGKIEQALQVADYSRARTLNEGLGLLKETSSFQPDAVNAREIARVASPSSRTKREKGGPTTILFYWLGEKQSYLWAITPLRIQLFSLPPAAEIDAAVGRYRKALLGPEDPAEVSNSDGLWLYRALVAPAEGMLPGKGAVRSQGQASTAEDTGEHRVFVIPDGSLNTLNFETLLVGDAKLHYWIEDVTIADASSLRLLGVPQRLKLQAISRDSGTAESRIRDSSVQARVERVSLRRSAQLAALAGGGMPPPLHEQLLLIGNAMSANADYPELRKASTEMESIEKHFGSGQERVFAREAATPAAYLGSRPEEFSYIHFVAHGTASRMNPLDSAIMLSASGSQEDSFKLYARDIIQHPLRAELVTISTCYGAGSRAYSGEGLVGLSWAFLRAGSHHVIGALWEVSDVSTPPLMDHLYGELQNGQSPDSALRAAKLKLLHSGTSFRRPFYWAPFQLYTGS